MRLNFALIFFTLILCWSSSQGQKVKFTLDLQNAPLQTLIQEIEKKSDYYFIYQDNIFDGTPQITIKVKNGTLESILREIENQTSLETKYIKQQIILTRKKEEQSVSSFQTNKIYGKVTDNEGVPMAGVTVIKAGSFIGTLTDTTGYYELEIPDSSAILVFSYIGMTTREVETGSMKKIDVALSYETIQIQEVLAVGYGTVKKVENTGSIASLKPTAFKDFPITSFEQGLKGRLAGVQVTPSSGQPGAGINVRIRGVSSLAGANEPLYVIDGIPMFNSDVRELNGLSWLNAGDISSVEVLKDAIATSIYGSRASNGVILVKTKYGNPGKLQITYDSYVAVQNLSKKLPLMNGQEFIDYATEYYTNAVKISEEQKQQNLNAINSYGNANTNWQDEVFRTALNHAHNITFSGGNRDNLYYMSLNYISQNGIVENTDLTNYNYRLNFKNSITSWLDISGRTALSKIVQNGFLPGDGTNTRNNQKSGIGATLLVPSTIGVYDKNGNFSSVLAYPFSYDVMDNPVAMLQALDKNTMYYTTGNFDLDAKLLPGVTNTMRLGIEYTNKTHDFYLPGTLQQLGAQTAKLDETKLIGNIFEDFFTFKKLYHEKFSFETILGFSAQWQNYQKISLSGTGFPSDDLQNNAIQSANSVSTPQTLRTKTKLASFFSRIQLGYLNKYYLSLSARYDGSSVFSENNKWAAFPAVAFAWRVSEEDFLNHSKNWSLKLRSSWGLTGNQAIQPYQSLFVGKIVNTGQGAGSGINVGLIPTLSNKNLTWETTEQFNTGIDFGFFNERANLVFDYYIRNTKDFLANVTLPGSSGYPWFVDNIGSLQNKGFELSAGADIISNNDWLLTADINFSKNNNVVLATKNNQDIIPVKTDDASRTTTIVRVGEPLFSFYMPKFLGIDKSGKPTYEDLNNDGNIDPEDNQIVGSSLPDFFYGFDLLLKYRKFSMSMNWQGVNGANLNNVSLIDLTNPEPISNRLKNIKDYYPLVSDEYIVWNSDRFIEDASYLRLKNIKLACDLTGIFNRIEDLTVYVSGQNLLTFTKYTGYEPDVNSFSNDNNLQGIDYAAFPSAKTITLGINLKF